MLRRNKSNAAPDAALTPEAEKRRQLIRRISYELMTRGIVVAVLGAIVGGLIYFSGEVSAEYRRAQNRLGNLQVEVRTLQGKLDTAQKSAEVYQYIKERQQKEGVDVDREKARVFLLAMQEKFHLGELRASFDPITPMSGDNYSKKTMQGFNTQGMLTISGASDEEIMEFISAFYAGMPGYIRGLNFTLTKARDITSSEVTLLSQTGKGMFLNGEFRFQWRGIRPVPANKTPSAPPPGATP